MPNRRRFLGWLPAAALALACGCSRSFSGTAGGRCPQIAGRRIRWIVPNAPGGGFDNESRLLQPFLERELGAEIVVENIAGAGSRIGVRTIAQARPDGLTLGIANSSGLLMAAISGEADAPHPLHDLTILGRLSRSWHVWACRPDSPFRSVEDVIAEAARRPIVFGLNEIGSASFLAIAVSAALLGIDIELVGGYMGSRGVSLAVLRGEIDLVCFNFETVRSIIESGELRPLLLITAGPVSDPALAGVQVFGGGDGWAARRTSELGRDPDVAARQAGAAIDLIGSGRVVIGPAGLPADLSRCIGSALRDVLVDPAFRQAAAGAALDIADGDAARAEIERAAADAPLLLPLIETAIARTRR